jgi:hypothetical protein
VVLSVLPLACQSAPSQSLFGSGNGVDDGTGGTSISGAGGFAGSPFGSGGALNPGTGGIPSPSTGGIMGAGGIPAAGGFNAGGSSLDGSLPMGGAFGTGGAGPIDAGSSGGTGPADARPDVGHECPSGDYTGTLSGPYTATLGDTTFRANLEFTVEPGGTIAGTLTSTSDSTSRATLNGKINCATGETSIAIVNGTYRNFLGTTQYEGTMTAMFDPSTSSFPNGKWEITEPNSPGSGSGNWKAQ